MNDSILMSDPLVCTQEQCLRAVQDEIKRRAPATPSALTDAMNSIKILLPELWDRAFPNAASVSATIGKILGDDDANLSALGNTYHAELAAELARNGGSLDKAHPVALAKARATTAPVKNLNPFPVAPIRFSQNPLNPHSSAGLANDGNPFCAQDYSILAMYTSADADDTNLPGSQRSAALAHTLAATANATEGKSNKAKMHRGLAEYHAGKAGIALPAAA